MAGKPKQDTRGLLKGSLEQASGGFATGSTA